MDKLHLMIYLDHNATTPIHPEVFEAMLPYLTEQWGNSSGSYRFGSKLKNVVEGARGAVASRLRKSRKKLREF